MFLGVLLIGRECKDRVACSVLMGAVFCINEMLRSLTENYEEEQNDRGDSVEALSRWCRQECLHRE